MKKLILLLIIVSLLPLAGCASVAKREARAERKAKARIIMGSNLKLGMTKDEVIALCGQPSQMGSMMQKNGKPLDSFFYLKTKYNGWTGATRTKDFFIYFEDDKIVYYGGAPIVPETR